MLQVADPAGELSAVYPVCTQAIVTHPFRVCAYRPSIAFLQGARPARELSALQQRLAAAEAEAQGLKAALDAAQDRHAQQLAK